MSDILSVLFRVPVVFADVIGSRLFEVVLQVISSDLLSEVFPKCFSKHLVDMALHPVANFVLQKLITRAAQEEEVRSSRGCEILIFF